MAIGPSTTTTPYITPTAAGVSLTSILTVGDEVAGYDTDGTPDGMGAFDNGDGTFTLLVNHEFTSAEGAPRAHGNTTGSFVSEYVISKSDLSVVSGQDLDQHVFSWNTATHSYVAATGAQLNFARFCSADLADPRAYYNASTGLGTDDRIFLNGEESVSGTDQGRIIAHVVTGEQAHNAYELASFGNYAVENELANWGTGDLTLVAGNEDTAGGQIYFYQGQKQAEGAAIEKAGLVGGTLSAVKVIGGFGGQANEDNAHDLAGSGYHAQFQLLNLGDVSNLNAAQLQAAGAAAGQSGFNRPEDGAWDPNDASKYYFVTTAGYPGASRLWELDFADVKHPELGGTVTELLNGTEGQAMLDNITVSANGHIVMLEDVGNSPRAGRVWDLDLATHTLAELARHDEARFGEELTPGSNVVDPNHLPTPPFNQDEEASGVIDVTSILGSATQRAYLLDTQAHYKLNGEEVEGGQIQVMYVDNADPSVEGQVLNGVAGEHDETLRGSANDDTIHGYQGDDRLFGEAGADHVYGDAGNDTLILGDGDDWGYGGQGADTVNGQAGADFLFGGAGADSLNGAEGNDVLHGDAGNDRVQAGDGADIVFGDEGADELNGGAGADTIYGGQGADTMTGGEGHEAFVFTSINDSTPVARDLIK
ncbi:MAG TPA: calcium-binding protein, partial [Phenylobacterium sp.]|uniref:calcium-binding protein n=1 Tax=Phenylobacterium sp. TaxID=1871053 RepID=UPI002B49AF6D